MSLLKPASRCPSRAKVSLDKPSISSKGSKVNKRDEIIKNKVYCPIELKDVYQLLEETDNVLANKSIGSNELLALDEKLNEWINICKNFKVNPVNPTRQGSKKSFNPIEKNLQYLNKHIETARKDSIILQKKVKKFTDPNYISNLEQKIKNVDSNIDYTKKDIKTLKDNIRKNEKLLNSDGKKPNEVLLQKEYKNLLNQQSTLCSRLIQLQNANNVYEENIAKIDTQFEEIKKKIEELNVLENEHSKEKNISETANENSKEYLEKKVFTLNTKRDTLKKEKNAAIANLSNNLSKLKKQISNLENAKSALLNEEKENNEKLEILKRSINSKSMRSSNFEVKTKRKEKKEQEPSIIQINTTNEQSDEKEEKEKKEYNKEREKVEDAIIKDPNFIENLLEEKITPISNEEIIYLKQAFDEEDSDNQEPSPYEQVELKINEHEKKKQEEIEEQDEEAWKCEEVNLKEDTLSDTENEVIQTNCENKENEEYTNLTMKLNSIKKGEEKEKEENKKKSEFIPSFEDDILLKLQNEINIKLNMDEICNDESEKEMDVETEEQANNVQNFEEEKEVNNEQEKEEEEEEEEENNDDDDDDDDDNEFNKETEIEEEEGTKNDTLQQFKLHKIKREPISEDETSTKTAEEKHTGEGNNFKDQPTEEITGEILGEENDESEILMKQTSEESEEEEEEAELPTNDNEHVVTPLSDNEAGNVNEESVEEEEEEENVDEEEEEEEEDEEEVEVEEEVEEEEEQEEREEKEPEEKEAEEEETKTQEEINGNKEKNEGDNNENKEYDEEKNEENNASKV